MVKQDGKWQHATLTNYANEAELRDLLVDSPDLIPGCGTSAAMTELVIPGIGKADVVLVDSSGAITIVEVKLASNSQVRREVVGQILAYASGLKGMGFDEFSERAAKRLGASLLSAVQEGLGQPVDADETRRRLSETLEEGSFTLVVAVDEITDELKGIIEYLNDHLSEEVSVMALELGVLKLDGTDVLVPATYGAELLPLSVGPGGKAAWTTEQVLAAKAAVPPGASRDLLDRLWQHATQAGAQIKGGVGAASPSAGVYYRLGSDTRSLWSVWLPENGSPRVSLNLGSLRSTSETAAHLVVEQVRSCPELDQALGLPAEDAEAIGKFPAVELDLLDSEGCGLDALYAAVELAAATSLAPVAEEPAGRSGRNAEVDGHSG